MEFHLDSRIIDILKPDENDIITLSPENFQGANNKLILNLESIIDALGNLSAKVKR
jgi:hypothetical protein